MTGLTKRKSEQLFYSPFSWQSALPDDPERAMHRLFRLVQQRNRYVLREPRTNLSLLEAHILTELDAAPGSAQRELLQLLEVSQVGLSLAGADLEKRGLLLRKRDQRDRRVVHYFLTPEGVKVVRESDAVTDTTFSQLSKELNSKEKSELIHFFKVLADGAGQLPGIARSGEHPFRLQQRRLTRALGLLQPQVFGSSFSVTEWQVLAEIGLYSGMIFAKDIEQRLGIPASTLTSIFRRLEQSELIERKSLESDTRKKVLLLTGDGSKELSKIEARASNQIQAALKGHTNAKKKMWVKILSRYALGEFALSQSSSDAIVFHVAQTPEQKKQVRSFIITAAVRENFTDDLPATIAGEGQLALYGLSRGGEICVAMVLDHQGTQWAISSAATTRKQYINDMLTWLTTSPQGPRHSSMPVSAFGRLARW